MKLWMVFYETEMDPGIEFFFVLAPNEEAAKLEGQKGLEEMFEESVKYHPLTHVESVHPMVGASDGQDYDISKGWPA